MTRVPPVAGGMAAAVLLGTFCVQHLQTAATGWDAAEYVWAIEAGLLPHSPYVGHLLVARAVAWLLPTATALSVVSAISLLGATLLVGIAGARASESANVDAAFAPAALFAAAPVALHQASIQEVYALQTLVLVGAACLAGRPGWRGALASGGAFGFALAVHSGSLLVAPALLVALAGFEKRSDLAQRILAWAAGAVAIVALFALWAWSFIATDDPARFLAYLRGIAPAPAGPSLDGVLALVAMVAKGDAIAWAVPLVVLAAAGGVVLRRSPHVVLAAALWPVGFVTYEVSLGHNVDPGVYLVYLLPPLALLGGAAAHAFVRRLPRVGPLLLVAALALYTAGNWRAVAPRVPPELSTAFDASPLVRASRYLREALPVDAVVVQPVFLGNVNLLPSLHLRQPVIFQDGHYLLMQPYRRGQPINLDSFVPVTAPLLRALLAKGREIVLYDLALVERVEGFAADPVPIPAYPGLTYFRLRAL